MGGRLCLFGGLAGGRVGLAFLRFFFLGHQIGHGFLEVLELVFRQRVAPGPEAGVDRLDLLLDLLGRRRVGARLGAPRESGLAVGLL